MILCVRFPFYAVNRQLGFAIVGQNLVAPSIAKSDFLRDPRQASVAGTVAFDRFFRAQLDISHRLEEVGKEYFGEERSPYEYGLGLETDLLGPRALRCQSNLPCL